MNSTHTGTADRVSFHEAQRLFNGGATILVSDSGLEQLTVTSASTVHTQATTTWSELVEQVRMWRNRYPGQRFYVLRQNI